MHYGRAVYSANFQDSDVHFVVVKPEWENDYVLYTIMWITGRTKYGKD